MSERSVRDSRQSRRVSVVGILPGPVNGMTLVTRRVVHALAESMPIRVFDLAHSRWKQGPAWSLARIARSAAALPRLLTWPRIEGDVFYTPVNSGTGLWLNYLHVLAARRRGYRCVLHHHTYAYLDRPDSRMRRLVQATGKNDLHVLLCKRMEERFVDLYRPRGETLLLPSSVVGLPPAPSRSRLDSPFLLGHFGNLSRAKGLNTVDRLFEHLLARGAPVRLLLAGPTSDREARSTLRRMLETYGQHMEYRGPLHDEHAKTSFYRELHAFLFPRTYHPESWGIVIHEAMVSAVPVLTHARGCIPDIVTGSAGLAIPAGHDFVRPAAERIEEWIGDPASWSRASEAARARGLELRSSAEESLRQFVSNLRGGHGVADEAARFRDEKSP